MYEPKSSLFSASPLGGLHLVRRKIQVDTLEVLTSWNKLRNYARSSNALSIDLSQTRSTERECELEATAIFLQLNFYIPGLWENSHSVQLVY